MNIEITPKGSRILLEYKKNLEKELTVKPFSVNGDCKMYKMYRKSKKYIYIPKYYTNNTLISLDNTLVRLDYKTEKCIISFNKVLREYQIPICSKVLDEINKNYSAVASLYTGWGKTCLALWIAHSLKVKTLIVVHTCTLLEQWIIKIKEFTGIDAGIIQQNKVIIDSPICVGMLHSLCLRNYPAEVTAGFELLIFDECHHVPSEMFSGVFFNMSIKYSLGLSATLKRKDGLSKVINWFLGKTIVNIQQINYIPDIDQISFYPKIPFEEQIMLNGKPNLPAMITDLTVNDERNSFILKIINKLYGESRKILVLTDRRNHAEYLYSQLTELSAGLYLGSMKINELNETNTKKIVIATYQMASEGYDNPELDTLILSTPKSDVEQAVGRILRQRNINSPLVIDIQDHHSLFNNMNMKRSKFYIKKGFINIERNIPTNLEFRN